MSFGVGGIHRGEGRGGGTRMILAGVANTEGRDRCDDMRISDR